MGNTVVKSETDLLEDIESCSSANCDCADFQYVESIRSSIASEFSEFSVPLEDAVSLTTDSTSSATGYESAVENEVSLNRTSSCTDVSSDISVDSKTSLREINDQFSCSEDRHETLSGATIEESKMTNSDSIIHDWTVSGYGTNDFEISSVNVLSLNAERDIILDTITLQHETDHILKNDCVAISSTEKYDCNLKRSPGEKLVSYSGKNNSCTTFAKSCPNDSTLSLPYKDVSLDFKIAAANNIHISSSNTIVQKQSQCAKDFIFENHILKINCGNKLTDVRGRQISKKLKFNSILRLEKNSSKIKSNFQKLPVVYKDFLILNYEHVFKEKPKLEYDEFKYVGNVFQKAPDTVTVVLETSKVKKNDTALQPITALPELFSCKLANILNMWALYSPFFELTMLNVVISYGRNIYRLEQIIVEQFFTNQYHFINFMNNIKFCIECHAGSLRYVAAIPKQQSGDMFGNVRKLMEETLKRDFSSQHKIRAIINVFEDYSESNLPKTTHEGVVGAVNSDQSHLADVGKSTASYIAPKKREPSMATSPCSSLSLIEEDPQNADLMSEGWSDLCSMNSESSLEFPSLRSDIADCVFQLSSIDSNIMNYSENVSEAGPITAADIDNINNIPLLNDSSDLDFISKVGGTGLVAENLRKQSLYVKFDPLVAADEANGDVTLKLNDSVTLSSNETISNTTLENKTEEKEQVTDLKINENGAIGKLISVTPNKSPRKKKVKSELALTEEAYIWATPKSSPRYPDTDSDDVAKLQSLLLKQMKKEETFKEEIELLKRDNEQALLKAQNMEKEMSQLKSILESVQENEKKLKNELKERIKNKQQLSIVMEEYEKTISQMVTRREEEKKEFEATIKKIEADRDSTVQHLNNLENAFNDIHQKYERGKIVNEALKKNEDLLKKSLSEYEVTVKTVENKYELLKSHATSQLEKANQELELITQSYEKEQAKLKAMLRKSEIQINSLQNALDRKTKENQELTAICDELIVKLSTHPNA